jgi:hypothetical protein
MIKRGSSLGMFFDLNLNYFLCYDYHYLNHSNEELLNKYISVLEKLLDWIVYAPMLDGRYMSRCVDNEINMRIFVDLHGVMLVSERCFKSTRLIAMKYDTEPAVVRRIANRILKKVMSSFKIKWIYELATGGNPLRDEIQFLSNKDIIKAKKNMKDYLSSKKKKRKKK